MNQKKLALFYIGIVCMQMVYVTLAQPGPGKGQGNMQPGTDGKGGHLDKHVEKDKNPNHWDSPKFIYRCADGSTMTGMLPSFKKGITSDDALELLIKHVRCSRVNRVVRDIPVTCPWFPTICPDNTVYIRGIKKLVKGSETHIQWACCVNALACNSGCQQKTQTLKSDEQVFFFPEQQTDSDQLAPSITSIMVHDVNGQATADWKFCPNTTICYTPPPGSPPGDQGSALGLLGLLGLLALLALGSPSSSSGAPAASTAAG
jgi:hypothetical protein